MASTPAPSGREEQRRILRSAASIARDLALEPHREGGWYRQTYISEGRVPSEILGGDYKGSRAYATSILFLISEESFSAFHRLVSDEIWYFHDGDPLELFVLDEQGRLIRHLLGSADRGYTPQMVVPRGRYFASRVAKGGQWSLSGCMVAPGFDWPDFELPVRKSLLERYPDHVDIILELTREQPLPE